MRRLMLITVAAAAAGTAPSPTCTADVNATTTTTETATYAHDSASIALSLSHAPPSASDLYGVRIKDRPRLVYSTRPELPATIGSPSSARFPLVAEAANATDAPIAAYAHAARALLEAELTKHGAVYFRGLPLDDGADLAEFVAALGWNAVKLGGGGTQRNDVAKGVRTASEEPPEQTIEPHGDMAHSVQHPTHIAFFCAEGPPPGVGGETVLTNMRGVYADLEASGVVSAFAERGGVAYHKRLWSSALHNHTGYTWQKFFFTEDLDAALTAVRERDAAAVVGKHAPGVIDFREVLPAVRPHPSTGEPIWFNGVHTNHRSYYVEAEHVDTSDGSPMDTSFADGTPIADETIAAVRAAVWSNSVAVRLRRGDLVIVDNYLAWHGRMSWVPPNPRRVLLTHFQQQPAAAGRSACGDAARGGSERC